MKRGTGALAEIQHHAGDLLRSLETCSISTCPMLNERQLIFNKS